MNIIRKFILLPVVLNLFDAVINKTTSATTGNDLSGEMKTFYSDYLIDMAEPLLVHDQFGQKHPIPKNGGKTIEFRKYDPLPKATTALTEGVTPEGQKLNMGVITATVAQYGGFIELSDMLLLSAIDNNLVQATKLLGSQAGRTLDTITREVLNGGQPRQPVRRQQDRQREPLPDRGRRAPRCPLPQGDERAQDQRLLRGHHPPGLLLRPYE